MIKKKNLSAGVNANVSVEPTSASSANSNINNNIYITRKLGTTEMSSGLSASETDKEDILISRSVELEEIKKPEEEKDVKQIILETYAKILLTQDKALISNLISKNCIIVPVSSLCEIIKVMVKQSDVEIYINEDIKCCAAKANPIRKIEAIKIINASGEIITDFKTVFNKEYNELVNVYHLCLKYAVNQ